MVTTIVAKKQIKPEKMGNIEHPKVAAVLRHMKGNSLLLSFSKIYLQHLSSRYLDQQDWIKNVISREDF